MRGPHFDGHSASDSEGRDGMFVGGVGVHLQG